MFSTLYFKLDDTKLALRNNKHCGKPYKEGVLGVTINSKKIFGDYAEDLRSKACIYYKYITFEEVRHRKMSHRLIIKYLSCNSSTHLQKGSLSNYFFNF